MFSSTHGNCFYNCLADVAYFDRTKLVGDDGRIDYTNYTAAV